jgi:hypothetical protein
MGRGRKALLRGYNMNDEENNQLLEELKKSLKSLENQVEKCKKLITRIKSATFGDEEIIEKPKTKMAVKTFESAEEKVLKIADEYRNGEDKSLTWLITGRNINQKDLIKLLGKNGYVLPANTLKKNVKMAVERILRERY